MSELWERVNYKPIHSLKPHNQIVEILKIGHPQKVFIGVGMDTHTIIKLSRGLILELEGLNLQLSDIDEGTDVVGFGEADALAGIADVRAFKFYLGIGVSM